MSNVTNQEYTAWCEVRDRNTRAVTMREPEYGTHWAYDTGDVFQNMRQFIGPGNALGIMWPLYLRCVNDGIHFPINPKWLQNRYVPEQP